MTIGELYGDIQDIKTQSEFDTFFEKCVKYSMETHGNSRAMAEEYERSNIRYYAGHCSDEILHKTHYFLAGEGNKHIRGFHWANKAWYAEANKIKNGLINFGIYTSEGGTTGEMSVTWEEIGRKLVPCLWAFDDSWAVLAEFKDVLKELGKVDDKNITDTEFVEILLRCGFTDLTRYKCPEKEECH